jgi:hypothetical protein
MKTALFTLLIAAVLVPTSAFALHGHGQGIVGNAISISPCTGVSDGPATQQRFQILNSKGRLTAEAETDQNGLLKVNLPAGNYQVISAQQTEVEACLWPGRHVIVGHGRFTLFNIICHRINVFLCVKPPA